MANPKFERFPRGHFMPVYDRFSPPDIVGDMVRKCLGPSSTADHYRARALMIGNGLPPGYLASTVVGIAGRKSRVTYAAGIEESVRLVSPYAFAVVEKAITAVGIDGAVITSTLRTPQRQAEIMYGEASKDLAAQYALYGSTAEKVLDVFKANKEKQRTDVIKLMIEKIEALHKQGLRVSLHVSTVEQYEKLNVFDVGVNSTKKVAGPNFSINKITAAFEKLKKGGYINKLIDETRKTNNCWHLEIIPNAKTL